MAGQRISLPSYSMFASTLVYEVDDTVVFGLQQPAIVPDDTDVLYVVPVAGQNRLDLISTQFYGVPDLWWVIASVNNIADPLIGALTGVKLRIPVKARLASEGLLSV